ncbi:MAG TPA: ATP-binding protein [Burkholderiaceae bacterium]|nr:ATP-binding protein [Burkholderiaceae bacterium]
MSVAWIATLMFAWPAHAGITELHHAAAVIQPAGARPYQFPAMALPFAWDPMYGELDGSAEFVFAFPHAFAGPSPQGLFFERIGNRYALWLNGELIDDRISHLSDHDDFAKSPRYYVLPAALFRPDNELRVRIVAEGGRRGGLSPPMLGPAAEIKPLYLEEYWLQSQAPLILVVMTMFFGLMGLLIWWRERDPLFLYFSGAVLSWSVRISDPLFEHLPMDWRNWSLTLITAYTTYVFLCFKFGLEVARRKSHVEVRMSKLVSLLYLPALAVACIAIWFHWIPLWRAWRWTMITFTLGGSAALIWIAARHRTQEQIILATVFAVGVLSGVADYLATRASGETHGNAALSRYASLLIIFAFVWVMVERYVMAQRALQHSRDELAAKLGEREQEIAKIYATRSLVEREHAIAEERQRITRDLHDGLGMQITTVMHLAARSDTPREAIAHQLRDTLDQLKLTVDALEDVGNDIGTVLGNIRFRLAHRIESSGVRLQWEVERLPLLPDLTSGKVRHIQFIVLEAISNALNHAGARLLTLRAWHDADTGDVHIAIRDNGCGFDAVAGRRGRGMSNMQARAQALGAALTVRSESEGPHRGATIELRLPLPRIPVVQDETPQAARHEAISPLRHN